MTEEAAGQAAEDGVVTDSADSHPSGVTSGSLVMTDYELDLLEDAYNMTMTKTDGNRAEPGRVHPVRQL